MTAANLLDFDSLLRLKVPGLTALRQAVEDCHRLMQLVLEKNVRFQPQKVILLQSNRCQQGP